MAPSMDEPAQKYYQYNQNAFEAVVRLSRTAPGEYDQDEIRDDIEKYSSITSLGDIHERGLETIRDLLSNYRETEDQYPEAKGFGVIGQYGDGKTHFLTALHDLLTNESGLVCPEGMELLVLDPFNFQKNPASIVEALRERVAIELGQDAAARIPDVDVDRKEDTIEDLVKRGLSRDEAEKIFQGREVTEIEGDSAGRAFTEGCKETVQREAFDAIILLLDEIEGIARGGDVDYQDLDKYREFFNQIDPSTPVLMIMSSPREQWKKFENLHQAMMDRAFGPTPRQSLVLRPLNEEELADTWRERRKQYLLREGVAPPSPADHEYFPLHTTTLRGIHQIAQRGDSNRTAIKLMDEVYGEFLSQDEISWATPSDVIRVAIDRNVGEGGIFEREQFERLAENNERDVLMSIAGVINDGITKEELAEVLTLSESRIEQQLNKLESEAWIESRRVDDEDQFLLKKDHLDRLLIDEETGGKGEIVEAVQRIMGDSPTGDEFLRTNLLELLREQPPFSTDLVGGSYSEEESYFVMESSYGRFRDRRLLVTVGDYSTEQLDELRKKENAELAIVINLEDRNFADDRIYSLKTAPLTTKWEYGPTGLEYTIEEWVCAYRRLKDELDGADALLSGVRAETIGEILGIDEFEFGKNVDARLEDIYPKYPGPFEQINSNANKAYRSAIEKGLAGEEIGIDEIKTLGYAETDNAIRGYVNDWVQFDLVDRPDGQDLLPVTIKISESEQLILDAIEENDGGLRKRDLYDLMVSHGYEKADVDSFVELLKNRGQVRIDNGKIKKTTSDLVDAQLHLDVVEEVVDWLTDEDMPQKFRQEHIPQRDELIGKKQSCVDLFERLQAGEAVDAASNQTQHLIQQTNKLQGDVATTLEGLSNVEYAQRLTGIDDQFEEIESAGPDDKPTSSQFFTEVDALNTIGDELATGARAYIDNKFGLKDPEENVFMQFQDLRTEFVDNFRKIGPYSQYSSRGEIEEVMDIFSEIRPTVGEVRDAVTGVDQFEMKTRLAKRICRIATDVRDRLLEIERSRTEESLETTRERIEEVVEQGDTSHPEIAEAARDAAAGFDAAATQYVEVAQRIQQIGFQALDEKTVDEIDEAVSEAEEQFTEAESNLETAKRLIEQQADEVSAAVRRTRSRVRKIDSSEYSDRLTEIAAPDVRDTARGWRDDITTLADDLEDVAEDVLEAQPEAIKELNEMAAAYQRYEETIKPLGSHADRLSGIEQRYFEMARDGIPEGTLQSIQEARQEPLAEEPLPQIMALLDRIAEITEGVEISEPPLEERIRRALSEDTKTPDQLTQSIPSDAYQETPQEVVETLNGLIEDDEVALDYNGEVVLTR